MHRLQLVDFNTAKDLKELGFDWVCTAYYNRKGILTQNGVKGKIAIGYNMTESVVHAVKFKNLPTSICIAAPEQALVAKWFRDIHNIHVQIEPHFKQWFWEIRQINNDADSVAIYYVLKTQRRINPNAYKTFEEAELESIKEVIKYLKNEI